MNKFLLSLISIFIIFIIINCSQEAITSNPSKPDSKTTTTVKGVVSPPVISPDGGLFSSTVSVTITCATSQAQIRYTTNGSDPTETSPLYTSPIVIESTTTIKVRAFKSGMTPSLVITRTFTIQGTVAAPTFSMPEGEYDSEFNVTINSLTSGSTIYYTTDGSIPNSNSIKYTSQVLINKNTILKAIAIKNGISSNVSSINKLLFKSKRAEF